ncbi:MULTISPECIES: hypothetical protein [unclassified Microcoleus]|uniref:hypothetical protein n=1 Tax=unclassified Microcoleus TaxID=2642155 RepID=UPI002FD50DCF
MKRSFCRVKAIISGTQETLELLEKQPEYQAMAYAYGQSNDFAIPNDLVLANAIQALREIYHAIVESECYFPGCEREIPSTHENINVFDLLGS